MLDNRLYISKLTNSIFLQVFDLKAVRKAVDYGFDIFGPRNELYNVIGPQSRNDFYNVVSKFENDENENPEMAVQVEKVKEEMNLRRSITVAIGGLMKKQECWQQAACYTGVYARKIPGKDLALL